MQWEVYLRDSGISAAILQAAHQEAGRKSARKEDGGAEKDVKVLQLCSEGGLIKIN